MSVRKPSWKIRRRLIVAVLIFCAFCVTYIMVWGDDRSIHEMIILSAFGTAVSVLGSYVFGAVWDDNNVMRRLGKQAYLDTHIENTPEGQNNDDERIG